MSAHQPQAEARRKLLAAARGAWPAFSREGRLLPRAFFLTDPKRTPDPAPVAGRLPAGFGVIFRHFGAADRIEVAHALAAACRRRGLVLLVAADPHLALKIGADGVHWPMARLEQVRMRHPGWIETASAHGGRDIARAALLGVDAVLASSVFASRSESASAPKGALRFRALVRQAALPVYALGGITPANAARAVSGAGANAGSGAAGWAAIDAVVEAWGKTGAG